MRIFRGLQLQVIGDLVFVSVIGLKFVDRLRGSCRGLLLSKRLFDLRDGLESCWFLFFAGHWINSCKQIDDNGVMPTTLTSVLLYAVLLLPGIAYVHESDRRHPSAKQSAFRETGKAFTVSIVAFGIMLIIVMIASFCSEVLRGAFVRFVRDPGGTFASYPRTWIGAFLLYLAVSVALSIIAANKEWWQKIQVKWEKDGDIIPESAWESMLSRDLDNKSIQVDAVRHANIMLKSGRRVRGQIATWSPRLEDDLDKAVVLLRPISVRTPESHEYIRLKGADKMVIHASEIEYLTVLFGDKQGNRLYGQTFDQE